MDMEQHDAETFDVEKKFAEARAKKKEKFYGLNDFEICKKGQKKLKAVWARHRFSQKINVRICFVCREKQKSKQNKLIYSFFGRIYGATIYWT